MIADKRTRQHVFSLIWCVFCLVTVQVDGGQYGPINSPTQFSKILKQVRAGDIIIIADGRYENWSVSVDCQGTVDHPVTIQPQTKRGVTFTGRSNFRLSGSYINLVGFLFDQCDLGVSTIEFEQAEHCSLLDCSFQHFSGAKAVVTIRTGSHYNTVANCQFINIAGRSVLLPLNEETISGGTPTGNTIRDNLFRDIPAKNANGRETIKIGSAQPVNGHIRTKTIVEQNTFIRCNGEGEIISNKCSGNVYRNNVFLDCEGELVMRGGHDCQIEGNLFDGCRGGIRLSGTNHSVKNNVIINSDGTGIRLLYGMTKDQGGHYQAAGQCVVSNNTIINARRAGILIGDGRNRDWKSKGIQNVAPLENRVLNNIITGTEGNLLFANHAPNNTIDGNVLYQQGNATVTNPGDHPLFIDPQFPNAVPTTATGSISFESFMPGIPLPGKGASLVKLK